MKYSILKWIALVIGLTITMGFGNATFADDFTYCSKERKKCEFKGTRVVRYGADNVYAYKVASDGVDCNRTVFEDPLPGRAKSCYYSDLVDDSSANYSYCSPERMNCEFSGTRVIRFGVKGKYNYKVLTDGAYCGHGVFGDPARGTSKACYSGTELGGILFTSRPDSDGYSFCTGEGKKCEFKGTRVVRYGNKDSFKYKLATDGIDCNNTVFEDPVRGAAKYCSYSKLVDDNSVAYSHCSVEKTNCKFSGTRVVKFGSKGSYRYKLSSNAIYCNTAVFGDPKPGEKKACYSSARVSGALDVSDPSYTNQGKDTETLDVLTFGNASSESDHNLVSDNTETVAGAMGQTARRMLPRDPAELYGGNLTFDLDVDPNKRNYVSVKFWGDDGGHADIGRIYLYVIDGKKEYQVGYRHEGDYMPLSVATWGVDLSGRFFYSTTMLPFEMTRGKSSIKLRLVTTGKLHGLGKGGPPDGTYQLAMKRPSKAVYRAYSHTEAFLNVSDETQASLPRSSAKPGPGEEILGKDGAFTKRLNDRIGNRMWQKVEKLGQGDAAYLAKAYHTPETSAYHKDEVVDKVVAILDKYATNFYPQQKADGWGGAYGYIGRTIHYLREELKDYYDKVQDYGDGGKMTRRQAWAEMLFASREYGRLTRSARSLTNQAMIANDNIYMANKGLQHLGDSRAFKEEVAQRYIKEACGLLPWLGSDLPDGGHKMEFGSDYYLVTRKGQTRERGYVGATYGEMAFFVADWYEASGNKAFRNQAAKMLKARGPFRRPGLEVEDGKAYRTMLAVGLLSWRGARESDGEIAGALAYAGRAAETHPIRVVGATADPTLIGYAKHMLDDNRLFSTLMASKNYVKTLAALDVYKDYQVLKKARDNGVRLPMADAKSDYAWVDEENAIAAVKHGDERLWVSAFWQAKYGINSVARFHYSTAAYDQYGVMETTPLFQTKQWTTRPSYYIDKPEGNQWAPPNRPSQAYGGELLPIGNIPANARANQPFIGKADFYRLRFGHFLLGINAHPKKSFLLMAENDQGNATNLFNGQQYADAVNVRPLSSVALYLDAEADQKPRPSTPIWLEATGNGKTAEIEWSAASGAKHYSVVRAERLAGPYQVVGTKIKGTHFTDRNLPEANKLYYFRVVPFSDGGRGYPSTAVTPVYSSLPDGWTDANIGANATGTSLYDPAEAVIKPRGTGWDVGGKGDSVHFTYQKVDGDTTLIAQVKDWKGGTTRNKIGLMIRETLKSGSKNAMVMLDQDQKFLRFSARGGHGKSTKYTNASDQSIWSYKWLKINRSGNAITGYGSNDEGKNWAKVGEAKIDMGSEVYIGMAIAPRSGTHELTASYKILDLKK